MIKTPTYSCWIRKNTSLIERNKTELFDNIINSSKLDKNDIELLDSIRYNYVLIITTKNTEPKNSILTYIIEVFDKNNEKIDTVGDVVVLTGDDIKNKISKYINYINNMFEKHDTDITNIDGDDLLEIKEKIDKCWKANQTI